MRQSDIIDRVAEIIKAAGVDASPENYEVCHRYVTRSDPKVCRAFERALAQSSRIDAQAFQVICDEAGPPPGQIDVTRHMANLDRQIATMIGAAEEAAGNAASYSASLTDGASHLGALNLGAEAAAVIGNLVAQTQSMSKRTALLEASLASASAELSEVRGDLEKARQESSTDALTSLPNRRTFDSKLAEAVEAAEASKQPLSLAFCDIDHFKKFNDNWGHKLGDEVLRYVAGRMANYFDPGGFPARFGGEEFVVLLPQHGPDQALATVRSFCEVLSSRVLKHRGDGREVGVITLSVGVATLRPQEEAKTLIERADEAIYAAKKAGRNRVEFASG